MELVVSTSNNHILAHAITDNPYQARNFLLPHLSSHFTLEDAHTIRTKDNLIIKTTPEISPLLAPTPLILNEVPFQIFKPTPPPPPPKDNTLTTLKQLCSQLDIPPIVARRILRKHFGANNVRYEWPAPQVPQILKLLQTPCPR